MHLCHVYFPNPFFAFFFPPKNATSSAVRAISQVMSALNFYFSKRELCAIAGYQKETSVSATVCQTVCGSVKYCITWPVAVHGCFHHYVCHFLIIVCWMHECFKYMPPSPPLDPAPSLAPPCPHWVELGSALSVLYPHHMHGEGCNFISL